jgi:putative flippase GtrA
VPPPIFFGLVGAASTSIDVALYLLLTGAEYTSPVLANALSYGLAAISSFVLNKLITFRHRRLQTRAIM